MKKPSYCPQCHGPHVAVVHYGAGSQSGLACASCGWHTTQSGFDFNSIFWNTRWRRRNLFRVAMNPGYLYPEDDQGI